MNSRTTSCPFLGFKKISVFAWLMNCLQVTDIVHLISGVTNLICKSGDRCQCCLVRTSLLAHDAPQRVRPCLSYIIFLWFTALAGQHESRWGNRSLRII